MQDAEILSKDLNTAIPFPCPPASFSPQPDFSASVSSTFLKRSSLISSIRALSGSLPARCASSSIKHSCPQPKLEAYTERHQTTGISVLTFVQLTLEADAKLYLLLFV